MEQQQLIADWEARAKAAGVSIAKVCKEAEIPQPSFSKWKKGLNGITLGSITRIERALSELETEAPARPSKEGAAA